MIDIVDRLRDYADGLSGYAADMMGDAAAEIERLREENKLLFDLFHEAVALPQGECPRPLTAGNGMFNPLHHAVKNMRCK